MRARTRSFAGQSWATFVNHAGAVLACDFFVVVTATFQRLYVFVVLDIATRKVVHWSVTDRPTAAWTIQQFRNGLPLDSAYRFLVHDRDAIFAPAVDDALRSMSLRVLKTPVRTPQANNGERPHSALGPGLPARPTRTAALTGHQLRPDHRVVARARLGGLHHDYRLEPAAA